MWIVPTPCEISPLWTTLQQDKYFALQYANLEEGSSSVWNNLVGTLHAMFDTKQAPYRIVLKLAPIEIIPGDRSLKIAVANTKREIENAWKWLHANVVPDIEVESEWRNIVQVVCDRIEPLVSKDVVGTDEGAADDRFRATARSFRQIFALRETERLVNYYSCSLGGSLFNQGWLYISEHFIAFYSFVMGVETKILIELKNITDIRKERSKKNLVPDSISVSTSHGKELFFSNLFHRDEAYECLQLLVNKTLHKMLETASKGPSLPESSNNGGSKINSTESSPLKPILGTPTLKENLEKERQKILIQSIFNVPQGENVLKKTWSIMWTERRPDDIYRGELFLTDRFLLFIAADRVECSLVLLASAAQRMEKVYDDRATSSRDSPYVVSLTTIHHQRIYFTVGGNPRQCDHFSFLLKEVLMNNMDITGQVKQLIGSFPSERLVLGDERCPETRHGLGRKFGYPSFDQKRETILLEYWAGYFSDNGRNFSMLRTPFFNRLVRAAVPSELRGEIWAFCSGAVLEELFSSGLYSELLTSGRDQRLTLAMEEIEKDLHRSLPEYPAYQCEEGVDALRNVLTRYALHDPELGYCQAMNIVTAVLLIFVDEETAFWILNFFCRHSLPGYYSADMHGAVLDQAIFEVLVHRHLPRLWIHLTTMGMQLSMATLQWFLTLFIGSFDLSLSLKILDCFFLDGAPFLFRLGLVILSENEDMIIETVSEEGSLMKLLRDYCLSSSKHNIEINGRTTSPFQMILVRAHTDYAETVTMNAIDNLRREHKLKVIQGIADYTKKLTVRETVDALFMNCKLKSLDPALVNKAVTFYYDVFSSVLFYHGAGTKFSLGLDVDCFLIFLSHVVTWFITSPVQKDRESKPTAMIKYCIYLFNSNHQKRRGRIVFSETASLLLTIYMASLAEFCKDLYKTFYHEHEKQLDYNGLIEITEVLTAMTSIGGARTTTIGENLENDELMYSILNLLKSFPMDSKISLDVFLAKIRSSSPLKEFFSDGIKKTVLVEPIKTLPNKECSETSGSTILGDLWQHVKSPLMKIGREKEKLDDSTITTQTAAITAASMSATIYTPSIDTTLLTDMKGIDTEANVEDLLEELRLSIK